jgi:hypothetical protein
VYDIIGVVPEPGTGWLLGAGRHRPGAEGRARSEFKKPWRPQMKTNWIVGLTVGMLLALAQAAYPQILDPFSVPLGVSGGPENFTSLSTTTTNDYNTTTVNQQVNQYSTELIAQMAGGPVLFDQTFNVAFSDLTVQTAVAQATGVLTGAGATSITGPTETSSSQTLVSSSSTVQDTLVSSALSPPFLSSNVYIGPQTIMVGANQSEAFTLLAGQIDVDDLAYITNVYDQTVTNTDTYLTTTV